MTSIHSVLSPDLILEILDSLAVPLPLHQRSCNLFVLSACSLVCKAWSYHAQRLLFRRVILPHNIYRDPHLRAITPNILPSFLAAIDPTTERGRWLAESVISLTVRHTGRAPTSDSTALADALLRTPNLRHLDVTTISCDFSSETLAQLRESGPRLTSICILQDFSPFEAQHTRIMHQLVSAFPSIRLLEITADLAAALPPFDPPPRLALAGIKFNTALVPDIAPCLASLIDPEETSLQLLSHKSRTLPSALEDVLNTHNAHLRSLSVKTLDPTQAAQLAQCTQLQRFELGRFPDSGTLALIPRTITSLAIAGTPLPGELDALVEQLATFPQLKTLTWSSCQDSSLLSLRVLPSMCTKRGIALRTTTAAEPTDDNAVEIQLRRKYIR